MIFKDSFEEVTVGDVILSVAGSPKKCTPRILRVDNVDYDPEYITEYNTRGKVCYCTDLQDSSTADEGVVRIQESNYLDHLGENSYMDDEMIETVWRGLEDIPMDPDTECLEASYFIFPCRINRMKIWKWFDEHYSKGVRSLLYGDDETKE